MSGDRPAIVVMAEADTVLTRSVEALAAFPQDQPWVLVGGLAVFIGLGSITRPTAYADTLARSQVALVQRLVEDEVPTVVSGGHLEVEIGGAPVEIDVMDLADDPLPRDAERRAFALARRAALSEAIRSGSSSRTAPVQRLLMRRSRSPASRRWSP